MKPSIAALITLLSLAVVPLSSLARSSGRLVGNGGDVIVCDAGSPHPENIELLDHYEARIIHGLDIDFKVSSNSVDQRVHSGLRRLARLSPDRASRYAKWANEFMDEAQFLKDIQLVDIPDSQHMVIPKGCRIQQIANQATILLPGQKRYTIDQELWSQLDPDQKAGLILHEVTYREALELGHTHSIATRWLAALVSSPLLDEFSLPQFTDLLVTLEFPNIRIQGVLVELFNFKNNQIMVHETEFHNKGVLKLARVTKGSHYIPPQDSIYPLPLRHQVEFFASGQIQSLYLAQPTIIPIEDKEFLFAPQILRFHEKGHLALGVLEGPQSLEQGNYSFLVSGHIQFHPNGNLQQVKIKEGQWQSPWGPLKLRHQAKLFENGDPQVLELFHPGQVRALGSSFEIQGQVEFYPGLNFKSLWLNENHLPLSLQNTKVLISKYMSVQFYPNGSLKKFTLAKKARLRDIQGKILTFDANEEIILTREGLVKETL